jgi:hypothetical protein
MNFQSDSDTSGIQYKVLKFCMNLDLQRLCSFIRIIIKKIGNYNVETVQNVVIW